MAESELVFKALADTTRLRLLQVLSVEALSVSELVEVLDQPQSTISRHLKVLRGAGLLVDRRSGATVMYSAWPPGPEVPGNGGGQPSFEPRGWRGGVASLRSRLLEWIGHEELPDDFQNRIQRVVHRRQSEESGFFDTVGGRWDQLRIEAFGDVFHLEALTWALPASWTVADIGTGTGYLLPVLAARLRQVIAVDASPTMLEVARSRPECVGLTNIVFREGSLEDLPLEAAEVDLAITSLVLHHVPAPAEALVGLRRSIRAGGRLLIIEQEAHGEASFHERMGDHWWGFTPEQLNGWVRDAGFKGIRTAPLRTARPAARRLGDSPPLFMLTADA